MFVILFFLPIFSLSNFQKYEWVKKHAQFWNHNIIISLLLQFFDSIVSFFIHM